MNSPTVSHPNRPPCLWIPAKRKREPSPKTPPIRNIISTPRTPKPKRRKRIYQDENFMKSLCSHSTTDNDNHSVQYSSMFPDSTCSSSRNKSSSPRIFCQTFHRKSGSEQGSAMTSPLWPKNSPSAFEDDLQQQQEQTSPLARRNLATGKENISLKRQALNNKLHNQILSPLKESSSHNRKTVPASTASLSTTPRSTTGDDDISNTFSELALSRGTESPRKLVNHKSHFAKPKMREQKKYSSSRKQYVDATPLKPLRVQRKLFCSSPILAVGGNPKVSTSSTTQKRPPPHHHEDESSPLFHPSNQDWIQSEENRMMQNFCAAFGPDMTPNTLNSIQSMHDCHILDHMEEG